MTDTTHPEHIADEQSSGLKDPTLESNLLDRPSRCAALARGVLDCMNVSWDELVGRSRRVKYSQPRKILAYLLRDIGDLIGGRDHSTVLYWVKSTEKDRAQVEVLDRLIEDIQKRAKEYIPQSRWK